MNQLHESIAATIAPPDSSRGSVSPRRESESYTVPPDSSSFDPELGRLLEQITARLIAGECLDLETLAREHREHAESLRELVPAMAAVAGLAQPELDAAGTQGHQSPPRELGDFRILREIGRGGMGVVYEAEQLSLGRRVALKVLPFAAMLDERQLARFKNEARAAATLQHANIVPVYAVGCERGVHYYAMQLVEGRSMAEVLAALRGECSHLAPRDETSASSPCLPVSPSPGLSPGAIPARRDASCATGSASALPLPPGEGRGEGALNPETTSPQASQSRDLNPPAPDTVAAALPTRTDSASQSGDIRKSKYIHSVANLAIQAANALDHAHQLGIVHRDIKPANLLLECKPLAPRSGAIPARRHGSCATGSASALPLPLGEGRGEGALNPEPRTLTPVRLWVTDFGLARIQADAGMTMTGDLVGTLRYMSPEQALAQRVVVDHRTDIYSLGVTLYELLTLQPAFDGTDRQEVLRKIAFDEPTPPRKLNPAIPQDLETIVLKAIAKSPDERYHTARDLADDLQRFVDDKSIHAKPPSLVQRARKWSRRHKAVIWPVAVCLLVALIALAGNIGWAIRDRVTRRLVAETAATVALDEATRLIQQSKWPEARAALGRADDVLAVAEYRGASTARADDLRADIEMGVKLEGIEFRLNTAPNAETMVRNDEARDRDPLVDELYAQAFKEYGIDVDAAEPAEVADSIKVRAIRLDLAGALDRWSLFQRRINAAGWQRLLTIARLADPDPLRCQLRDLSLLRPHEVKPAIRNLATSLPAENLEPTTVRFLVRLLIDSREPDTAIMLLRRARQRHPDDYRIVFALAQALYFDSSDADEAIRYYTVALSLRADSALAHNHLGNLLRGKKSLDEARFHLEEAVRLAPNSPFAHCSLGVLYMEQGLVDEAISCQRKAIHFPPDESVPKDHAASGKFTLEPDYRLLEKIGLLDESMAAWKQLLILDPQDGPAYKCLALAYAHKRQYVESAANFREAIRLAPTDALLQFQIGLMFQRAKQWDEAITHHREAIRLKPDYASAHRCLGTCFLDKGLIDEAIAQLKEAIRLNPKDVGAHSNLGACYWAKGLMDEALVEAKEVLRQEPSYIHAHIGMVCIYEEKGMLDDAIAHCKDLIQLAPASALGYKMLSVNLRKKGATDEALASANEAVRLEPNSAEAHAELAEVLVDKGRLDEALASATEAIRLGPNIADGYEAAGKVLVAMGQVDEGRVSYIRALQIAHGNPQHLKLIYRGAMEVFEKNQVDQDVQERFSREAKAIMEPKASSADQESKN